MKSQEESGNKLRVEWTPTAQALLRIVVRSFDHCAMGCSVTQQARFLSIIDLNARVASSASASTKPMWLAASMTQCANSSLTLEME